MATALRESGKTSTNGIELKVETEVLGWFSNKYNPAAGWVIFALDEFEKGDLANQGVDSSHVFRVCVDGRTSLCRINPKTQTYAFADNLAIIEDGEYRFERAEKYKELVIDSKNELYRLML